MVKFVNATPEACKLLCDDEFNNIELNGGIGNCTSFTSFVYPDALQPTDEQKNYCALVYQDEGVLHPSREIIGFQKRGRFSYTSICYTVTPCPEDPATRRRLEEPLSSAKKSQIVTRRELEASLPEPQSNKPSVVSNKLSTKRNLQATDNYCYTKELGTCVPAEGDDTDRAFARMFFDEDYQA